MNVIWQTMWPPMVLSPFALHSHQLHVWQQCIRCNHPLNSTNRSFTNDLTVHSGWAHAPCWGPTAGAIVSLVFSFVVEWPLSNLQPWWLHTQQWHGGTGICEGPDENRRIVLFFIDWHFAKAIWRCALQSSVVWTGTLILPSSGHSS